MNGYRLDLVVKFLEVHNERFAQSFEKNAFDGTGERRQMRKYRCRGITEAIKI